LPNLPGELHSEDEFGLTKPTSEHEPEVVFSLDGRAGQKLEALASFTVLPDGSLGQVTPLAANSESAWRAIADALLARTYKAGAIRDRPVAVAYKQGISYQTVLGGRIDVLNGAKSLADPVFPYDRMVAQDSGHAVVKFSLYETGAVDKAEIVEASHPDFGRALLAAAESWVFSPEAARNKKNASTGTSLSRFRPRTASSASRRWRATA
jgi:TonB family protein